MASEEPPPGAPGAYAWIGELSKQGEDAVALEGVIHGNRQLGATIFLLFDEQSKDKSVAHICSFGWNLWSIPLLIVTGVSNYVCVIVTNSEPNALEKKKMEVYGHKGTQFKIASEFRLH